MVDKTALKFAVRVGSIAGIGSFVIQEGFVGKLGQLAYSSFSVVGLGPVLGTRVQGGNKLATDIEAKHSEYSARVLKKVIRDMSEAHSKLQAKASSEAEKAKQGRMRIFHFAKSLVHRAQINKIHESELTLKDAYTKQARRERQQKLLYGLRVFGVVGAATVVGISVTRSVANVIKRKHQLRKYKEVAAASGTNLEGEEVPLTLPCVDEQLEQVIPDDCMYDKKEVITRLLLDSNAGYQVGLKLREAGLPESGLKFGDLPQLKQYISTEGNKNNEDYKSKKQQYDALKQSYDKINELMANNMDIRPSMMQLYGAKVVPTHLRTTDRKYGGSPQGSVYCPEGCDYLVQMYTSRAEEPNLRQKMWDTFMRDTTLNLDNTNRLIAAHGTVNRALFIVNSTQLGNPSFMNLLSEELNNSFPVVDKIIKIASAPLDIEENTKDTQLPDMSKFIKTGLGLLCVAGLRYGVKGIRTLRPVKKDF